MKKAADFSTKLLLFFAKVDGFLTGCAEFRWTVAWGYKKTPDESRGFVGSGGVCGRVPCGVGNLVLTIGTLARVVVENDFAHAHGFGRYFHVFVFANVFQRFFE